MYICIANDILKIHKDGTQLQKLQIQSKLRPEAQLSAWQILALAHQLLPGVERILYKPRRGGEDENTTKIQFYEVLSITTQNSTTSM